jgi:hypothetical protein
LGIERVRKHQAGIDHYDRSITLLERHRPEEAPEEPRTRRVRDDLPCVV